MTYLARVPSDLTGDQFLEADQRAFGDAWHYELVDGVIVVQSAPSSRHGAILAGLVAALGSRLKGRPNGLSPEAGSGAVPLREQRNTARIPDALVRCGGHPRVTFEIVSPSELRDWQARDKKRRDVQDVEGVVEIIELYQREMAVHSYRKLAGGNWEFNSAGGADAILEIRPLNMSSPLVEIYEFATFDEESD